MENGKEDLEMGMEKFFGQMEFHTKGNGSSGKLKEEASLNTRTQTSMKDNGKIASAMVMESTNTEMEQSLLVNGEMTFNMDSGLRNGQMALALKGCIKMERNKEWESISGMINLST
jgi:hypothetical protein